MSGEQGGGSFPQNTPNSRTPTPETAPGSQKDCSADRSAVRPTAADIKAAVSLPDVIEASGYTLHGSGQTLTAECPFHADRHPSLTVYEDHYHCFPCGAHGDLFDWL